MANKSSIIVKRVRRYVTGLTYNEAKAIVHEGIVCPWCDQEHPNLIKHITLAHDRGLENNRVQPKQRAPS